MKQVMGFFTVWATLKKISFLFINVNTVILLLLTYFQNKLVKAVLLLLLKIMNAFYQLYTYITFTEMETRSIWYSEEKNLSIFLVFTNFYSEERRDDPFEKNLFLVHVHTL